MSDETQWVKIERAFDAPIETVWRMWTEADLFMTWYGPMGMSVPVAEMDVAVGGQRKICMEMGPPDRKMSMWFTGVYKEVSPPHRLVYTESMCDENGILVSPASMGMPDGHPDITEVIVELRRSGDKTEMTMVHVGVPVGTAGEGGWNQAISKLGALLSEDG